MKTRSATLLVPTALALALALAAHGACSGPGPAEAAPDGAVATRLPPDKQQALSEIEQELRASEGMTASEFGARYAVPFAGGLGYGPLAAQNLSLLQSSALELDAAEKSALAKNGFVISERRRFPTFTYGYATIYAEDLPVYVSADSILFALHRSYDEMLKAIELAALIPDLDAMLGEMRATLAAGAASALGEGARADADLYLAVAKSLLGDGPAPAVAGASQAEIDALVEGARAASGSKEITLFGSARVVDFSQFKPRGHYTDALELERYFRATMWLGRIDLRILETQPDHTQVFQRRHFEGAVALAALLEGEARKRWSRIFDTVGAFVGEPDSMTVPEVDALLGDLGAQGLAGLAAIPDATIAQAVVSGGYGTQRIASHVMMNGLGSGTMPLSSSFLLLGQRYVVDSHVFSNVVYDRVQKGAVKRMMPSPLDAAFAALGNDQAGQLLSPGLEAHRYAPDLHMMRFLVDEHESAFWDANLYNLWLSSLRALSPGGEIAEPGSGLPAIARTEPWGRRLLNTQLASWAELRHDTVLYAKQSYTGGSTCEFPDAYVDPYPRFFERVGAFASNGLGLLSELDLSGAPWLSAKIEKYFVRLGEVAGILEEMAEHERAGKPLSDAHMAFVNEAVVLQEGCGSVEGAAGWYADLFFDVASSVALDPTIADVHTQPFNEHGAEVGRVLHVGTGMPRLMVVTIDTCGGPRAYAGLASSYFERVTENFERQGDPAWKAELVTATPPDVGWMRDLVAR